MQLRTFIIALALGLGTPHAAMAAGDHKGDAHAPSAAGAAMTTGEIKKVDKDAHKITIKHGPIQNLDMPAMTMVFQVKDPAMLDKVATGDQIKFVAEKSGGALVVTRIEAGK